MHEEAVADMQNAQAAQAGKLFTTQQRIDHFLFFIRWFRRRNIQLVTRGGDETAEPLLEVFRLANHIDHHGAQTFEFILFNPARMLAAGEVRIAVVLAAEIVLQHIVGEAADQVAAVWPAEADGVVQGGFVGYAVVRESRWNIEDVARLQIFINDRWERIDVQQCRMRTELTHRQLVTHAPAAAAHALNNKDVILIEKNTLLLLCSPHNPTGKVWRREELETMAALCQKHGVRVISDEIHMDMTWGEHRHIPWSEVAQGPWALFTSGSKSFNIPAFTGAYGFIPEENERDSYLQALKGRDGLSSPSVPALVAHIAAYRDGAPWLDALRDYLQANMRYVADTLNNAFPALGWQPPEATYLAWIDLRPLNVDDRALQQALIAEQKVAIMPGYTYGPEGNGFLRLNVGCPREKLERGVEGLIAALRSLS